MTEENSLASDSSADFEIVDIPENLQRRGRWNNLIEQLKNLPDDKAIRLHISKFGKNGKDLPSQRSTIYAAARAEGFRASFATIGEYVYIARTSGEED
jgi:hypothetical protein